MCYFLLLYVVLLFKFGLGIVVIVVMIMILVVEGRIEVGVVVDEFKKDEIDISVDVKCEGLMGSIGWVDDVGRG